MKKRIGLFVFLIVLFTAGIISVSRAQFLFQEPAENFPGGNPAPPLDTSALTQEKEGDLRLGGKLDFTANPSARSVLQFEKGQWLNVGADFSFIPLAQDGTTVFRNENGPVYFNSQGIRFKDIAPFEGAATGTLIYDNGVFRFFDGTLWRVIGEGGGTGTSIGGGIWLRDSGGTVYLETESDSVGIGTSAPSEKLTVQGNFKAESIPSETGFQYEWNGMVVIGHSNTPRCPCDVDANSGDCQNPFISQNNVGQTCWDWSFGSFAERNQDISWRFERTPEIAVSGGIGYFHNKIVVGDSDLPVGHAPAVVLSPPSSGKYEFRNRFGNLEIVSGQGVRLVMGQDGALALHTSGGQNQLTVNSAGNVGIGTASPVQRLDVAGAVKIGNVSSVGSGDAGTIRWNGSSFEGWTGSSWVRLDSVAAGGGGGVTSVNSGNGGISVSPTTGDVSVSINAPSCSGTNQKLLWTGNGFTCGIDQTGGGNNSITGVFGSNGVTGGGTSGNIILSADIPYLKNNGLQARVTGECSKQNEAIWAIDENGGVSCKTISGGGGTSGVTSVNGANGILVNQTTGDVQLSADTNYLQRRLKKDSCASNEFIRGIDKNGNVTCAVDATGTGGGNGTITGIIPDTNNARKGILVNAKSTEGTFSGNATIGIDPDFIQRRVSGSCPGNGQDYITSIDEGGGVTCGTDKKGVTKVGTGPGLVGGPITTRGTISIRAPLCKGTNQKLLWTGTTFACGIDQTGGGSQSPWQNGSNGAIYYNNGNVGIGINNPRENLSVVGDVRVSGKLNIGSDAVIGNNLTVSNTNSIASIAGKLDVGDNAAFYKNVAVGTVTSYYVFVASPDGTVGAYDGYLTPTCDCDNNDPINIGCDKVPGTQKHTSSNVSACYDQFKWTNPETGQTLQLSNRYERRVSSLGNITVAGNVGIGTTNPQAKLHIVGGDIVAGRQGEEFIFHTRSSQGGDFLQITDRDSGGNWKWRQGLVLTQGGRVGINTTSPRSALDVNGTINTTGFRMQNGAQNGYVLTSDASGNATWQPAPSTGGITGYVVVTNSVLTPYSASDLFRDDTKNLSRMEKNIFAELMKEAKAQEEECPPEALDCGVGGGGPSPPPPKKFAFVKVSCPSNKKVLGGGCRAIPDTPLLKSYPYPDNVWNGWYCASEYHSGATLTAYAICANVQ